MYYSLHSLLEFIINTNAALLQPLEEGNYEGLVTIMGHLYEVRKRQEQYDNMFKPLTDTINLLKIYDVQMPEDVYTLIQVR